MRRTARTDRRRPAAGRPATAAALVALLSSGILLATAADARSQQRPAFTTTTALVRVDVIATDQDGRFVADLRPDEFVLYEDDVEQRISSTQIVDLAAGTVSEFVPVRAPSGSGGDATAAPVASRTRIVPAAASRDFGAVIFLIDLPGLDRRNKDRFARAWLDVLDDDTAVGVPRAVYMIDQVGRLQELAPLSLSVEALRDAALEVLDAPLVRRGVHARLLRVAADLLGDDAVDFAAAEATDLNEIRASEAQERARSRVTLELLTQFCNALSAREGRTALVWVSSELLLAEGGPGTALAAARVIDGNPGFETGVVDRSRRTGDTLFSYLAMDTRLSTLQRDLHRAANSANVSIYSFDPAPESERRSLSADIQVTSSDLADLMNSSTVQTSLDGLKDALWSAAEETGGRASIGATEMDNALRSIARDTSRFYLLSYTPPAPHGDGAFHSIRVAVQRPGVSVRARSGYVDLSADDRASRALAAALVLPGSVDALPVDVRPLRGWSRDGEPVVKLVVALEQDLAQQQAGLPEGFWHQIHATAVDEEGAVVGEINQQMQPNGRVSRRVRSGERPIVYLHEWPLPQTAVELRVAVRDGSSGELGAASRPVVPIDPSPGWRASDLMLAVADEGGRAQPLMSRWVYSDEPLYAYLEVRDGIEPVLSGHLLDAAGDERLAPLPQTPLEVDAVGIHRGALRLRNLLPGDYVLEVEVVDAEAGQQRSFRVPLQVLA